MQQPIPTPAAPIDSRLSGLSGPSEAEFPPFLGGMAAKGTDGQKPTPKKEKKASVPIVPSVVVSKARK
jgi:hypothetical protein